MLACCDLAKDVALLQRENFYTGIIERGIRERRKGKKEKKNSSEEEKEGKEIKKKIECHF